MNRSALLFAGLLASTTALAQTAAAPPPKDGERPRMQDFVAAKFSEADSNHDGNLSQSEWQSARLREANDAFQRMARGERFREQRERLRGLDTDGDQQLSRAEIGDQAPRLAADFDNLDSNRDGKLSRDEIHAGRERAQAREGGEAR